MKKSILTFVAAVILSGLAPAQGGFGFVDVQKVILGYEKTKTITESLEKELRARYEELRQKGAKIQEMKEDLDLVQAGTLEQLQRLKTIRLLEVDLQLEEKKAQALLERRLVDHMKKVYDEVLKEVEIVARDKGLMAVFMVNSEKIDGRSRDEIGSNILVRPVLWWDPNRDLTAELIQRLNR